MKKAIKVSRYSFLRLLKIALLVVCFSASSIATYSGFSDMIYQSDLSIFWKKFASGSCTLAVQGIILYSSILWWRNQNRYHLFPLCLFVLISVTFSLGFYFDLSSLDRTHAGQIYTEQRNKMITAAESNRNHIQNLVERMEGLVIHSAGMVEREAKGGNTCNSPWHGFGPRAAFRKKDKETFDYYAKTFGRTAGRFDRVYEKMNNGDFTDYTPHNAEKLNRYAQEMNAITDDFNVDKGDLIEWLSQRIRHNHPGYVELFDNGIVRGEIRCEDMYIEREFSYLVKKESFDEISLVDISNPDESGVQVMQAISSLSDFIKGEISLPEIMVLVFAFAIDAGIFFLTMPLPGGSPPTSFSSWRDYFSTSEYKELLACMKVAKSKEVNFYISLDKKHLIAAMLPLTAKDLIVFKGKIPWYEEFFIVPRHIRAHGNNSGFNRYQTNHPVVAQWIMDFKHEEQKLSSHDATSHPSDAKPVSDSMPQTSNGGDNKEVGHDITKVSLNGNNKGVKDAVQ